MLMQICQADLVLRRKITTTWEQLRATSALFNPKDGLLSPGEAEYYEAVQFADNVVIFGGVHFPIPFRSLEYHEAILRSELREELGWADLLPRVQQDVNPRRRISIVVCESVLMRFRVPGYDACLERLHAAQDFGMTRVQFYPLSAPLTPALFQPFSILDWDDVADTKQFAVSWIHQSVDWVQDPKRQQVLERSWQQLVANSTRPDDLSSIVDRAHRQREGVAWERLIA